VRRRWGAGVHRGPAEDQGSGRAERVALRTGPDVSRGWFARLVAIVHSVEVGIAQGGAYS
jgi:hypothetical protein